VTNVTNLRPAARPHKRSEKELNDPATAPLPCYEQPTRAGTAPARTNRPMTARSSTTTRPRCCPSGSTSAPATSTRRRAVGSRSRGLPTRRPRSAAGRASRATVNERPPCRPWPPAFYAEGRGPRTRHLAFADCAQWAEDGPLDDGHARLPCLESGSPHAVGIRCAPWPARGTSSTALQFSARGDERNSEP
jgi:hypothetical protein